MSVNTTEAAMAAAADHQQANRQPSGAGDALGPGQAIGAVLQLDHKGRGQ